MKFKVDKSSLSAHKENAKDLFSAAISVDCVIFGYEHASLRVLCIHSEFQEYEGLPSLVGNLVLPNQTLDEAAELILETRTGLKGIRLQQIKSFGSPHRHPAGRVVTVAFCALINIKDYAIDEKRGLHPQWLDLNAINEMAFDHKEILSESLLYLKHRFFTDMLYASLLPEQFTLSELQQLAEVVLDEKFDKRNFRKKMLNSGLIIETNLRQQNVSHRPAKLFTTI